MRFDSILISLEQTKKHQRAASLQWKIEAEHTSKKRKGLRFLLFRFKNIFWKKSGNLSVKTAYFCYFWQQISTCVYFNLIKGWAVFGKLRNVRMLFSNFPLSQVNFLWKIQKNCGFWSLESLAFWMYETEYFVFQGMASNNQNINTIQSIRYL